MTTTQAARQRVGTRVRFEPSPVSRACYSGWIPATGAIGTVIRVSFGSHWRTFLNGPGGGLLYVNWGENFGIQGVSAWDCQRVGR